MRFLTDYLEGDTYFKTSYKGQNLDRCRTQLKLVSDMEAKWDEGLGGEAAMKECARVIKAEYDKNPSAYNFTFPTVE